MSPVAEFNKTPEKGLEIYVKTLESVKKRRLGAAEGLSG